MRTRLLAATLTAFAAVSLAACSSSGSDTTSAGPPSGPTPAASTTPDASAPTSAPAGDATTPPPPAPATGSPDTPATDAASPPPPGTPDAPAASKPAPPADAGLPTKPDAGLTTRLVAALDAIDPAIVGGKPEQAVDRARNQCQSMYQFPKDRAKLVELVNQRFTAPDHPQGFGGEKAEKILDALRTTLCPPA
ncbi:hypothetical protein [Kitasatospora sp. NPDC088351]|uniref:hypothetical protein n=1 Tax=unclassified Kitasatospora TaxID=2633591 RepID=UPI0034122CD0